MSLYGTTNNFGFNLIDYASQVWHADEYNNWRKLDSLLTGIASNTPFALDTGAADAYLVALMPVPTSYTDGMILAFTTTHVNTGASTINVNGLGVKSIKIQGAALVAGDIPANGYIKLTYNGTHFELIEPKKLDVVIDDESVTPAKLSLGGPDWDTGGNLTISGNNTVDGNSIAADFKTAASKFVFRHASATYLSGQITYSTVDPSGGNDGDLWFKYT
jgi:hypothetical protein